MFGLTGKSDVSIEELWSERSAQFAPFAPFASVTMSRERFQFISKNICFDDIHTREFRKTHKFHIMLQILTLFKENMKLIHRQTFYASMKHFMLFVVIAFVDKFHVKRPVTA